MMNQTAQDPSERVISSRLSPQFVCTDIGTRLAESTILQKHMISALPGVRLVCCSTDVFAR